MEKDGAKRMLVYTVQKGDTLWLIAKRFGISLESLIKANPQIKDPNKIFPGDKVKVPLPNEGEFFVYTVQAGDTMWSIARKFGISLDALIAANPQIKNPDVIDVGQKIRVPMSGGGKPGGTFQYTVQSGDTMWLIAKRFGVSLSALIKANPQIPDPDRIYPGQVINVPGKAPSPPSPPPKPTPPATGENNGRLYTVKNGDTFFNIAQRYALNLDSLILANPQICDPDRLKPGMQIYLPGNHYVKAGETLYSIAEMYGVSLQELIRINPQITDPNVINVGQRIAIPRQPNGNIATYTVKSGDSLYKIGQSYNVSVEALTMANPQISNPDKIFPGQKIAIPGPHIVMKGQTMWEIANLYGISLDDLLKANPDIQNPDRIHPGQMVKIPSCKKKPCPREEDESLDLRSGIDYVVQRGDTLSAIAAMYNVSVDSIVAANPEITDPDRIYAGQVLRIPVGHTKYVTYVVKQGDSLYKIARMYGVSLNNIIAANPQIENVDLIFPGQVIRVPLRRRSDEDDASDVSEDVEEERLATNHPRIYVVQKGDTLYHIAQKYNTTVKQLQLANPGLGDGDLIYPGQQLIILPSDMVCEYRCLDCPWFRQGMDE